jgi:hypothetical protein
MPRTEEHGAADYLLDISPSKPSRPSVGERYTAAIAAESEAAI